MLRRYRVYVEKPFNVRKLIERYCMRDELSTYDPYDIWKTRPGFYVKDLFNRNRYAGLIPAATLTLFDVFLNNSTRFFYSQQEYPIVRALAALSLLNLYEATADKLVMESAVSHLTWLDTHSNQGYSGKCWGIGFRYPVTPELIYDKNTGFSTITPYPLEAFDRYTRLTGVKAFTGTIRSVFDYFENDIAVIEDTPEYLVTSYGPVKDRVVYNAISYTMMAYSILASYRPEGESTYIQDKIRRLYRFIELGQRADGSWFYSADDGSFVDCFHSCIVIKNIMKTHSRFHLSGAEQVVQAGYRYLKEAFRKNNGTPFRRFSVSNKPSLIKYDLYDSAEMLSLSLIMGDQKLVREIRQVIRKYFIKGDSVYSKIDILGMKKDRDTLRWAVMPYLYAESEAVKDRAEKD